MQRKGRGPAACGSSRTPSATHSREAELPEPKELAAEAIAELESATQDLSAVIELLTADVEPRRPRDLGRKLKEWTMHTQKVTELPPRTKTSRKRVIRHRSAHLVADWQPGEQGEPFRQDFLMFFPLYQRKVLLLLAKLLYSHEAFKDEHFPLFRGSHSLALLNAAAADLRSIARSLALFASELQQPELIGASELPGRQLADRFAVRIDRLAKEIGLAIEAHKPPKPPRIRRPDAMKR